MMRMMMSDHLFGSELLLSPFWCLDAKGREESIYVYLMSLSSSFLFGFGL
jgi:hypothetical protein